jgi:hypothetical protein
MRRVRVQRPKRKRERPWLEALTAEPRDPTSFERRRSAAPPFGPRAVIPADA